MSQPTIDNRQEIDEQPVDDVWNLALMLGISEETLEAIIDEFPYNSEFEDNVIDRILDFIIPKLDEMGYDGDATYGSVYWFAKGYNAKKEAEAIEAEAINELMNLPFQPEIKYLGIPHAPKHPKAPKRYIDSNDSAYLNYIKRKHFNVKDKVNDKVRDILRKRFNEKIEKENTQIHASKANYKRMLDDLRKQTVLLRPLAPKEMLELKPYSQKMFENQNQELLEYFDKYGHEFKSIDEENLKVNEPYDEEKALECLENARRKYPKDYEVVEKNQKKDPMMVYYLNKIHKLEDIFEYLDNVVYKRERKPFKLTFEMGGVFEVPEKNYLQESDPKFNYEAREIIATKVKLDDTIPIVIQFSTDLDRVKYYIETNLHNHSTTSSNVKLIYVSNVAFTVSRLVKVSGKIDDLPVEFLKSKFVITDNEDDGLCWYRFLAICLEPKLGEAKTFKLKDRTQAARKLFCKDHGAEYTTRPTKAAQTLLKSFNGMTLDEMKESAKKHQINVNIYCYDKESNRYDIDQQWYDEKFEKTFNALLFSQDNVIHIMYITNAESLTNIWICPKCKSYAIRGKNPKRMEIHKAHCDGKFHKNYIPERVSMPYCPHILNHPVYEYCVAHDLKWQPQRYYMTYDFETMEQSVDEKSGKSTVINSRLIPLSVSCCIKSSKGLLTRHFDARSKDFIPEWLTFMFEQAYEIVDDKVQLMKDMLKISDVEVIKKLDKGLLDVPVLGFNSAKFDSNLFKEYFNYTHHDMQWKVDNSSLIGTTSSLKQFILKTSTDKGMIGLRFIDAQAFISGGTLKQFGVDFGGAENSVKGTFPYEAVNSENFDDVLSMSEPFKHKDFHSYLNQKNALSNKEYEEYLEDSKRFIDRWEYLLAYNDNDVEMMIKPIDNLIEMNAKYGIDMLSNLSLSRNASEIKYAMAYKNFDIDYDYGVLNSKNTFKPTKEWWTYKVNSYYSQDEKWNLKQEKSKQPKPLRDLSKCVSEADFDAFMKIYEDPELGKCHLCGEHFSWTNKPTLDRINNEIGHELSNCKLACEVCNSLRSADDDKVTRLRIQLKKFCKVNHLPMTITNEAEYHRLRAGITGGLSNVMHRVNLRGETCITRLHFDEEANKVVVRYTDNVVSHVVGVDFNSLYPSACSGNWHSFNKYHGGIMYMPGSMLNSYDCYDENGKRKPNVYHTCMSIINSKHRFDKNPKFIFHATVKLECPKDLINDFINFPPVFRNFEIKNDEDIIGSYMYKYGKDNNIHTVDKSDTKLTMTLDTRGEFKTFGCYYLWFLIDHGLEIVDIQNVTIYDCHRGFNAFVNEFMGERQKILSGEKPGNEKFYKISMNGSYGYDGLNTEHYDKVKIVDRDRAFIDIASETYVNGYPIANDSYIIQRKPKNFRCKTCVQESFFTLDNAKYWYLVFIYDFLFKCLDVERMHFTSCDTDSVYFAIAGDMNRHGEQVFDAIVKDKEFYDKYVYQFMPNPAIGTVADEKKILGAAVEKYGDNQVALCPKCYTIWNNKENGSMETKSLKVKGVSLKKNNINPTDYYTIIVDKCVIPGKNINLQMNRNQMSKVTIQKNALTGFHNKMIVLEDQTCVPFIKGLTANDVIIKSCEEYAKECENEFKNILNNKDLDAELLELGKNISENESEVSANGNSNNIPTYINDFEEGHWDLPLRTRFDENFKITFNKSKHGSCDGKHIGDLKCRNQTGMVLSVNETPGFAVIDIDINKKLPQKKRFEIKQSIISKLSEDDIIIETGSGSLHIYANHNIPGLYKNAYVKCFECDEFDIDYFASVDCNSYHGLMLPDSENENGRYEFYQGNWDSVIKRTATDVIKSLGVELDLSGKNGKEYNEDDDEEPLTYLDNDEEMKLVDGLVGMEVHNYASKIDDRLTLLPLFGAIKCLSPDNRDKAFYNVEFKCNLTCKASMNFETVKKDAKHSNINVLYKIIRMYNPEYYKKVLH